MVPPGESESTESWLAEQGDEQSYAANVVWGQIVELVGNDNFGGAHWTGATELNILALDPARVATADVAALINDQLTATSPEALRVTVTATGAKYTLAALDSVLAEVSAVLDDANRRTGATSSASVIVPENVVKVIMRDDLARELAPALTATHGDRVAVLDGPAVSDLLNRGMDANPFAGGGRIRHYSTPNYGYATVCTSGYTWRLWGTQTRVQSTAGHCWTRGTDVFNAQTRIGTVTHRAGPSGIADAEFFSAPAGISYSTNIWVGAVLTTTAWPVVGAIDETTAYIGHPIVTSGGNGGEARGNVTSVNATTCTSSGCKTGQTEFSTTSGAAAPGDSGGPCFSSPGGGASTVLARGTVSAGQSPGGVGALVWCTQVVEISAILEASIVTQ